MKIIFTGGGCVALHRLIGPHNHLVSNEIAIIESGEIINVEPEFAEALILKGVAERIPDPSKKQISVSLKMEDDHV